MPLHITTYYIFVLLSHFHTIAVGKVRMGKHDNVHRSWRKKSYNMSHGVRQIIFLQAFVETRARKLVLLSSDRIAVRRKAYRLKALGVLFAQYIKTKHIRYMYCTCAYITHK